MYANGQNAPPGLSAETLEKALESAGPLISCACTIGDARPYNIALLTLDPAAAQTVTDAGTSLTDAVHAEVELANARLARVEQIKRFHIVDSEWAPGVELTPTLKLRRRVIAQRYTETIGGIYTQPTPVHHTQHRSTP